ncbi:MAG: hypothetical protein ACTSP1_14545 [Candidatus Freyarchaeota archaeon]
MDSIQGFEKLSNLNLEISRVTRVVVMTGGKSGNFEKSGELKKYCRKRVLSVVKEATANLNCLKTEVVKLFREYTVMPEEVRKVASRISECYEYLRQLDQMLRDSALYYTVRKLFEELTLAYVSIEAYENGALPLPVLKLAIQRSGIIPQIERIISQIEVQIK